MTRTTHPCAGSRQPRGFSLIEVMVAVVILATGLLALAALQGALARNSGDAKARGAVMAALTSRMMDIRSDISEGRPLATKNWTVAEPWVRDAALQAGTSDLSVEETIETYRWNGTGYVTIPVSNPTSSFTRATLKAEWTGSDGRKLLTLRSHHSGEIYGDGRGYQVPNPHGSAAKVPIVRQALPSGVIPIVAGDQSTAAANSRPIRVGTTVVGTQFDDLAYEPAADTAIIRRRTETFNVKCRCTTGLAARDRISVSGAAQWPTVWDGDKYATFRPADKSRPPAEALSAGQDPRFVNTQDAKCTECCRDRIDFDGMSVRFGPEGEMQRYDDRLSPSNTGAFVAACRVIRNEGIFKTAADTYLRQFGLLATQSDPADSISEKDFAKKRVPRDEKPYQRFIAGYLRGYGASIGHTGTAPTTAPQAQEAFDAFEGGVLNAPSNIHIPAAIPGDVRYLYVQGLYVDHLTDAARARIQKAVKDCTLADKSVCLLRHLPSRSINLTEFQVNWEPLSPPPILVGKSSGEAFTPTPPLSPLCGGCTIGTRVTAGAHAKVWGSLSMSTLAFRPDIPFVNRQERDPINGLTDQQKFSVGP